ncbi:ABC transporter permease [Methylobacterium platani]|uniref:ABC transporter permease n=2 Tax=Methylobacterium platani TaxID=427683 RepID=A0A179RZL5_9HYPH|nr:ABC transporter permease [Methylobacterium platani]KMO19902.1 ABC transporter permease [Methylobacterium platani JCM 14648]OAS18086.1 ABC transporter permease [Methylobacterium platani]
MPASLAPRLALGLLVGLVLLFLVLPILIVVPMSFSNARFLTFPPPGYSLRWYEAFFGNPAWMQAARVSLGVALATALGATLIGTAAAYALSMSGSRLARSLTVILLLPLVVPIVITGIGVFFVFAKTGLLATLPGLVLANVMLATPYVVTAVLAGLRGFDPTQEMVARSLGMNRLRAFLAVTLPQIRPSVVSGALFAFISALDETVVAIFIAGGQNQTLTKRMFTALRDEIDPTIAAISSLLTAASLIVVVAASLSARKARNAP